MEVKYYTLDKRVLTVFLHIVGLRFFNGEPLFGFRFFQIRLQLQFLKLKIVIHDSVNSSPKMNG